MTKLYEAHRQALEVYGHLITGADEKAAEIVGAAFGRV